jgi:hypothetical protein
MRYWEEKNKQFVGNKNSSGIYLAFIDLVQAFDGVNRSCIA